MTDHPDKPDAKPRKDPAASAPRSVRDGLGAPRSRRGPRRPGRGGGRGAGDREPREAAKIGRAGADPSEPPTRRITTPSRTFTVGGEEWVATLVGSIRATATTAPAARLLEVEIRSSNGGESRFGYVAAADLEAAAPEELERLVVRSRPASPNSGRGAGRRDERRKGRSPGSS